MTLRKKVLILYVGIGILILLLVGGILWSKLRGDRFDLITADVDRQLAYLDFALTNFMTEVESDVRALAENEMIRSRDDAGFTNFLNTDEETFEYDIGDLESGIVDVLNAYRISHSYVNSVYMGRENGSFVRSHPRSQSTQYDPRERPWYTLAKEDPGRVVSTEPYQSVTTTDVNIGVVTALLDENGQVYGVVGADITLANLTDYISDFDVGNGGRLLLTDEYGTILANRDESVLFSDIRTAYGDKIADFVGESGDVIKIKDTYYFVHTSPELGWNIIALIPSNVINRQILSSVLSPLFGLSLALALLSILTLVGLNSFVIKPLKDLSETTQHIARTGDLKHQIDPGSEDEIGSLASSFNQMIAAISSKESDLLESEIKFRNLFESSRDAIVLSTAEGFIDCNLATLEMFGFKNKAEFTRLHMSDVSPSEQPDGHLSQKLAQEYINEAYTGDGILFEWEFQREDGTVFPAEVLLGPTEMYGALVVQGVIRDITNRKRDQEKLAHEYAFLRSLLDSVPDVIFVKDPEGVYLKSNQAYEALGWHEKELVGKTDHDLYPQELAERYREADAEVMAKGELIKYEDWKDYPDGRRILFETVKTPYRGPDGEVIGVIGISRDITAHRQIEEEVRTLNVELEERVRQRTAELTKFSLAIEHSPASVVITNKNGAIEYVNPKFTEMTGYVSDEAIGKNPRILKSGEHPAEFYKELWETVISGHEWSGEICNLRKTGERYWELGSISPILNDRGEITHFVSVREDITDRKRMESELVIAKERAEEATQAKGEFLANMSHEIRTPMNAVIGMTHLAMQTDLNPRQQDYLTKIQSSARSLLGIINDILDFSKIEAGKLDLEMTKFNLSEALENLATLINVRAQEKNLEIVFATDPDVPTALVGDPLRLEQVLVNLGNNAVKFTEQGEIIFSTRLLSEQDNQVTLEFSVRDTGVGMTREQLSQLFQAFSQADTSISRKYGGTGLGLVISKQLVEIMGGEIWGESRHGEGSEFIFTAVFTESTDGVEK
nr:PAS domain S-box protein [Chloroflexota bacterium]